MTSRNELTRIVEQHFRTGLLTVSFEPFKQRRDKKPKYTKTILPYLRCHKTVPTPPPAICIPHFSYRREHTSQLELVCPIHEPPRCHEHASQPNLRVGCACPIYEQTQALYIFVSDQETGERSQATYPQVQDLPMQMRSQGERWRGRYGAHEENTSFGSMYERPTETCLG
jgi:hypothetical protein